MSKNNDFSVNLCLYVKKDWDDKVEEYCNSTGRVKSRLIQLAVTKYMEENK